MSFLSEIFSGSGKGIGEGVKEVLSGVGSLATEVKTLVTGNLPPDKQAEFEIKWAELTGKIAEGQANINAIVSGRDWGTWWMNFYMSGWRPAAGWGTVLAIYYATLGVPILSYIARLTGLPAPPEVDYNMMMALLYQLLGLGTLRTYEKKTNIQDRH